MTCIVGYIDKTTNDVYIGGDSAGVAGLHVVKRADEKVFEKKNNRGKMVFGFTSSFRMGQILRYCFDIPDHDPRVDDYTYLCKDFISGLMDCYKKFGYFKRDDEGARRGGTFLMGYNGNLYNIEGDFQVGKVLDNFDACGCGVYYALGAMEILNKSNISSEEKVKQALKVAEKFSGGVMAPFNIINTGNK